MVSDDNGQVYERDGEKDERLCAVIHSTSLVSLHLYVKMVFRYMTYMVAKKGCPTATPSIRRRSKRDGRRLPFPMDFLNM